MKSNASKQLAGTLKPSRIRTPNVSKGKPDVPRHLSETARKEWRRIVATLDKLGTLTAADYSALELYAVTHERWQAALTTIKQEGHTFEAGNGYRQIHPAVTIAQKAEAQLITILRQLGLTPASREKVSAVPDDETPGAPTELLELR